LSRFRPDPAVLAELAEIDGQKDDYQVGIIPPTSVTPDRRVSGQRKRAGR
jgi:hypothetical protein